MNCYIFMSNMKKIVMGKQILICLFKRPWSILCAINGVDKNKGKYKCSVYNVRCYT